MHMQTTQARRIDHDADWSDLAAHWDIRPGTTYLNHGSFGPSPRIVRETRREWIDRLDAQPMDFYVRQLEPALSHARTAVAKFVGTTPANLVFAENATFGMNVVADSFPLKPGEEILLNDHEYGAVHRIWNRRADRTGAKVVSATMPERFESAEQLLGVLLASVTDQTRIVILSHVTSPTALIWPLEKLVPAFRERDIAVCIDGPHAPAQIPLDLDSLDCDFYLASCHKWLCGPLGTGFIYAHPRQHSRMQPQQKSWGRLLPALPQTWDEEFTWPGTRDPSGYLALPAATGFLGDVGLENFRQRTHWLASQAELRLRDMFGTTPMADRADGWYGNMAHVPLPPGDHSSLQDQLWQQHQIEIPIIFFKDRWYVRVSSHLYTTTAHFDILATALDLLTRGR